MMDRMEKEPLIQEGRRLPDVADVDGLVSFMGRLTEEQESFYLDLLLASLVRLHPFIKSDDVKRMMPVFEWAGTVMEMPESETGELDVLAASFLLDYAQMLTGSERRVKSSKQQSFQDYKPMAVSPGGPMMSSSRCTTNSPCLPPGLKMRSPISGVRSLEKVTELQNITTIMHRNHFSKLIL